MNKSLGKIVKVSGPVVEAEGLNVSLYDVVYVGYEKLIGEVIKINHNRYTIQVYEDTEGLKIGEPVETTGAPLSVELGPGLLKSIFDGIQRPLNILAKKDIFIKKGVKLNALDRKKKWFFEANVNIGDKVYKGDILGIIKETELIEHRILSPFDGKIKEIASGDYRITESFGLINSLGKDYDLTLIQTHPVRKAREYIKKLSPINPISTGQRVIDTFFPIAKGGTVAIPGPFGSGKTVIQHSLAKFSDTDIVIYVGCGERGNEMTEVLEQFPKLKDEKTGLPLEERTVLIANTSNMPVAAREASIYTGISIAEYYRDMGYDVAIMVDSSSRWAEALREIGGRLEEMPGEEGYPAYLGRKLAEFYERSGRVIALGSKERIGSVSIIAAVSPPGGDLNEPVTQNTLRIVKVFLALDASLAHKRHFPSINWLKSYSLYKDKVDEWLRNEIHADFPDIRDKAMEILYKESKLQELVQLVGMDALPEKQKIILMVANILKEDFLQQNAYDEIDCHSSLKKQYLMLRNIMLFYSLCEEAVEKNISISEIRKLSILNDIAKMKFVPETDLKDLETLKSKLFDEFRNLFQKVEK